MKLSLLRRLGDSHRRLPHGNVGQRNHASDVAAEDPDALSRLARTLEGEAPGSVRECCEAFGRSCARSPRPGFSAKRRTC